MGILLPILGTAAAVALRNPPIARAANSASAGRTFYVSAVGNDRSAGRTVSHPWRTVARVNSARLRPGDRVLFRAGDTFAGQSLMPPTSGSAGAPIVFSSYGHGRAKLSAHDGALFLPSGRSHLSFQRLQLTTGRDSPSSIVSSSVDGPGSVDITVSGCVLYDTGGAAILSKQPSDTGWQIVGNRIMDIGDSGIIVFGAKPLIARNTIVSVGRNSAIPWPKHGIYVKAAGAIMRANRIHGFPANGISLRYADATVTQNVIFGGPIGIAYFSYDPNPGTSVVSDNTIFDVTTAGFYYDPFTYGGGDFPQESFKLENNDIQTTGIALSVAGASHVHLGLVNNELRPGYTVAFAAAATTGGSYLESRNRLRGAPRVRWNGADVPFGAYRAASGQGLGDVARSSS